MRSWGIKLCLCFVAMFAASSPIHGASTEIRSKIAPVRIIEVDQREQIISIATNTHADIQPSVIKNGKTITYSANIQRQYAAIWQRVDKQKIGTVYRRPPLVSPKPLWYALTIRIVRLYVW